MKVLLTKPFFQQDLNYIQERLNEEIELITPKDYSEDSLAELAGNADAFLGGTITEKLLQNATKLQLIQIPWTGVDKLNYELLKKFEVKVANSHSNSGVVAEHAISLMFDAAKRIAYHDRTFRTGNWNRPKEDKSNQVSPFSVKIKNSKVAIIGFGAIGKDIYHYLKGFDCSFKVFNRTGNLSQNFENVTCFPISELNNQINDADIIFVSVALTEQTKGLLNNEFFNSVGKKAIFINVSRGEIVKEEALYNFLKENKTFFAGIDTWYKYPTKDNPNVFPSNNFNFHNLDNIVMSPHRAGMVQDCLPHLDDAVENLNRLFLGKDLINVISIENKY